METFIKLLRDSEYGVEVPYAGAYMAYVTPDEERGGYHLSYCKGMMPPHATGHADTAENAAEQVAKIAELSKARPITEEN